MSLPWLSHISSDNHQVAVNVDGDMYSYATLFEHIKRQHEAICVHHDYGELKRPLVLLRMSNTFEAVVKYLLCLVHQWPVLLVNNKLNHQAYEKLVEDFNPNITADSQGFCIQHGCQYELDPKLALLLTTSGSTGGGKCVALSYENLAANTQSICEYLPIHDQDVALASMPFSYAYGLSILHTHIAQGASVAMTPATVMDKSFWQFLQQANITSLSGVPHWYEMLIRLGLSNHHLPAMRYFTQAGGRLSKALLMKLCDYAQAKSLQFYRMYGQTEATARMAWKKQDRFSIKDNAIGEAIPGGELYLLSDTGERITTSNIAGELWYRGKNCMLGYVQSHADLSLLSANDELATGDIAQLDDEGEFILIGRKKRYLKLAGERVNLDGLEAQFSNNSLEVRCCGDDKRLFICCYARDNSRVVELAKQIISLPPAYYRLVSITDWPLLDNGKVDYISLLELVKQGGVK